MGRESNGRYGGVMVDDIQQDVREQNAQVHRDAEVLTQLLAHPGWKVFCSLVETVGQNFYMQLVQPLETVDGCVKAEYAKGTLNGLQTAVDLPARKIAESKSLRNPSHEEE